MNYWPAHRSGAFVLAAAGMALLPASTLAQDSAHVEPAANIPTPAPAPAGLPLQTGLGPRVGAYYLLRFNETAAPKRPAGAPTTGLNALKYIPLDAGGDVTLSLSGMERVQFNSYTHETLASQQMSNQLFLQFRHIYGTDLHLGPYVRA
jgi:hypothetical protein